MFKLNRTQSMLVAGDIVVMALVTVAGFVSHNTLTTGGSRILATFVPLVAAWLLIGPHVGVFDTQKARSGRELWRPFWAMILAAPLFGLFRAWMLGTEMILASFLVIMGGVSALSVLAWRTLFVYVIARRMTRAENHG